MNPLPLKFDAQGLVPVVVQDALTGEVRMQAFANQEALQRTLESGRATFWSRSRQELWQKGSTSGNGIAVHRILVDCDGDGVLYLSDPEGPSCHTGAPSCFFRALLPTGELAPAPEPQPFLGGLEEILEMRKTSTGAASYTKTLYDGGAPAIAAKLDEEASELGRALASESEERVASEAADLLYHVLVGLRSRGVAWRQVLAALASRTGSSGHAEKAARKLSPR